MNIVFKAPGKYIQQAGIINNIGAQTKSFGSSFLIVASNGGIKRFGDVISASISSTGGKCFFHIFGGETTQNEIDAICKTSAEYSCDAIIGVGGGKTIDAARGAADQLGAAMIIVPTVASNDSPCSALAVIHNESGEVIELRVTKRSPDLVLVDPEIILKAPSRLLVAGMGDALATYYEASATKKSGGGTTAGGECSDAALALSRLCRDILFEHGVKAIEAVNTGFVNESLEKVISANTFLSGLGFESGGVAAAHAINDGFSVIPEGSMMYHGEIVGFGVMCLLVLLDDTDELNKVIHFMRSVGLPVTLEALKMGHLTEDTLMTVSKAACASPVMANMPLKVTPDAVFNAIKQADRLGNSY